jgi:hypothetical protein
MIANKWPKRFKNNGNIDINKVLFHIGFKVEDDGVTKHKGYNTNFDVYIRDNNNPSRGYKTKCIFNGEVRNIVWLLDPKTNKPIYTKQIHPLYRLYEQFEVLQPKDIEKFIKSEDFVSTLDIGDPVVYDRATVD